MSVSGRRRGLIASTIPVLAITGVLVAFGCGGGGASSGAADVPLAPPARAADVDRQAALTAIRVVGKEGHPTHPVWYHDSQIVEHGDDVIVAFNGSSRTDIARLRRSDLEILGKIKVNRSPLGGNTDTTKTDTNRHDVPAIALDGQNALNVIYGGGTISGRSSKLSGPYWRRGVGGGFPGVLGREQSLNIGGGSAFDFETVRDNGGTVHLYGQHGSGDAGSLIELRLSPDGRWYAPRKVIDGGQTRGACVRGGRARGCNRFAIARTTVGADGRIHLVWGYSEASLSGSCSVDAGYCDHDLYYAVSKDNGATWSNLAADTSRSIPGAPISHNDKRFRVASGHVGLFKAIATTDSETLIVFTRRKGGLAGANTRFELRAMSLTDGVARESLIAAADRAWDASPVLRQDENGFHLWLATGSRIVRFSTADVAGPWSRRLVYRGTAWSLTGIPSSMPGRQLLLWRGRKSNGRSEVMLGVAPAAAPAVE